MTVVLRKPTLSLFIDKAYENYGFVSAFIYGSQGSGKTTYALKTLYYVYGSWEEALNNTYFYIDDLLPRLYDTFNRGERIKAILLDDAGVWLMKYHWRKDFSVWFSKLFNLLRTIVSGVIFTSVEATDIVKFVRDKMMYRVYVIKISNTHSIAIGYKVNITPLLEQYVERIFEDTYSLKLPNDVREKYEAKRREAISTLFQELKGIEIDREELLEELDRKIGLT